MFCWYFYKNCILHVLFNSRVFNWNSYNINGDPQIKYNKLGVHNDILVVHIENQFKRVVITKNKISTIIYTNGAQPTASDVKFGETIAYIWKNRSPRINKFSHPKCRKFVQNVALKILISKKEEKIFTCIIWQSVDLQK